MFQLSQDYRLLYMPAPKLETRVIITIFDPSDPARQNTLELCSPEDIAPPVDIVQAWTRFVLMQGRPACP